MASVVSIRLATEAAFCSEHRSIFSRTLAAAGGTGDEPIGHDGTT
jgi:hypothetical protein